MTTCVKCGAGPDKDLQRSGSGKPRAWECVEEEPCALRVQLRDAAAEIVRLRGLPVIPSCEACPHGHTCEEPGVLYCYHPDTPRWRIDGDTATPVTGVPPDWCPWRPDAKDKSTCRENRLAYLAAFGFDGHTCSACERPPME